MRDLCNGRLSFLPPEQAFFQRWVQQASVDQLDTASTLVARGQLEFVNGGWCMHGASTLSAHFRSLRPLKRLRASVKERLPTPPPPTHPLSSL